MATLAVHHAEIGWVGRYVFSTDHKVIAKQYLLNGLFFALFGGIIALMKTLAREHARQGLTFNTICPGPTDTPLLAKVGEPSGGKLVAALERAIPMRRLGSPEDFPGLVTFFLSEDAAFITGQTISVSGGLSMHG